MSAAPPAAKAGIAKTIIIAAMTNATADTKSMRLNLRYLPTLQGRTPQPRASYQGRYAGYKNRRNC